MPVALSLSYMQEMVHPTANSDDTFETSTISGRSGALRTRFDISASHFGKALEQVWAWWLLGCKHCWQSVLVDSIVAGAIAAGAFTFSGTCSVAGAPGAAGKLPAVALPKVWARWAPAQRAQALFLSLALWLSILNDFRYTVPP